MAYGRRVVRSSLKNYAKSGAKRRRLSVATRARLKPPTARNQRKQIYTLAKRVARNTKYIQAKKVFTDYQYGDSGAGTRGIAQICTNGNWYGWGLTNYQMWIPCLRQDANVQDSSRTFAVRMQLNCRVDVGNVTKGAFLNIFLVTPRKDKTNGIELNPPPDGQMAPLVLNGDYIENSQNQGTNIRLNSGKYCVKAAKYISLASDTLDDAVPAGQAVGNPFSTWRKFQWNVPLKWSVRNPGNRPWHQVVFQDQAYWRQYYLLVYTTNADGGNVGVNFSADPMYTCINFD